MVVLGRFFFTSLDVLQRIFRRTTSMFGEFAEQPTLNFIDGRPAQKSRKQTLGRQK